jgi:hypothetical protein
LQTIASSSDPTVHTLVAQRDIDGSLDSAQSVSSFITGIETQFDALRRALDMRSSELRMTTSYISTNADLLISSSAPVQPDPVDAMAANGYAAKQALVESCTSTKAFMLLVEAARRFYNGNVRDYNTKLQIFPTNIFARVFGFSTKQFFDIPDGGAESQPVEVKF